MTPKTSSQSLSQATSQSPGQLLGQSPDQAFAERRLVAVVVTYQRCDQLRVTLDALCATSPDTLAAIVVCDNASSDATQDYLATLTDPRIDVLRLPENTGGAGGFAAGMRAAMDRHAPDWLVVMDDDARPVPGTLERFMTGARTGADAWAGAVTYPSGQICDMNRPWVNPFGSPRAFARSLWRGRNGFHLAAAAYAPSAPPRPVDGASFVGFFVSADSVRARGTPDPALFLYGDDVLYTLALSQSGRSILFDPALRFIHDCETLSNGSPALRPLWKVYFFHRNQIFVYRRAAGPVLFWPVFALRALEWRLRARAYGPDRAAYLTLLGMALRDGLARRRGRTRADIVKILQDGTA